MRMTKKHNRLGAWMPPSTKEVTQMRYLESKNGMFLFTQEDRKAIGSRIRKIRERKGLHQDDVASVMGFKSANPIYKMEKGEGTLDVLNLMSLHQELEVSLPYILYGVDIDFPEMIGDDNMDEDEILRARKIKEIALDLEICDDEVIDQVREIVTNHLDSPR